jgi:DNA-binding response OmpR family regulator
LSTKSNKRIMIIDDDKDITNLFSIFLEYNGYIVNAYTNPVEAINNFRKNSHDLIILDVKMPKMDGMTLYHKIKKIDDKVIICLTTGDINIENLRCSFVNQFTSGDLRHFIVDKN